LHLIEPAARERWETLEAALISLERQVARERESLAAETVRTARKLTRQFMALHALVAA
jgi:hypothetical protein